MLSLFHLYCVVYSANSLNKELILVAGQGRRPFSFRAEPGPFIDTSLNSWIWQKDQPAIHEAIWSFDVIQDVINKNYYTNQFSCSLSQFISFV